MTKEEAEAHEVWRKSVWDKHKHMFEDYEMMTPEEAISRLPDTLNHGVRQHLIEKSKSENPLMFSLILSNAMRDNIFTLKPKDD